MESCEYAPYALRRARDPATSEQNPFSSLHYHASGTETDEQKEYLRKYNWICNPDDLLEENTNDILEGVEIISVSS